MRPGELVADRFEVLAEAGSGGMSVVFRARDRTSGEPVAVKVLQGSSFGARFARESRVLAELDHPGIVRYVAHGETDAGERWLAMEWLDGEDLAERLAHGGLSPREAIALVGRVAAALGFAHARGVVHRDIKPSNLFLRGHSVEEVKILDFGIAREVLTEAASDMTITGTRLGTPAYMSPEQARGLAELDSRVDVFALGCVLHECLSGTKAFSGEDAMALTAKILLDEPPKLRALGCAIPVELEELVTQMLAKDPAQRPADGNIVALLLGSLPPLADAPPATATPSALGGGERRLYSVVMARGAPEAAQLPSLVSAHGGKHETLADGSVVAAIAGSGAATDLAARAARCALAMRAAYDGGLVALATGRGVVSAALPLGEVIERAAALVRAGQRADATHGDAPAPRDSRRSVRLDEVTAGLLDARFDLGGDGEGLALRGERAPVEDQRKLLGKPTPCVGRETELSALEGAFDSCCEEPSARAVLVTAPAGVGKSRLRYELVRKLKARGEPLEVWIGRGDPMWAGAPFGMIGDAIRRVIGLSDADAPPVQRKKLRARLARHVPEAELDRLAEFIGELGGTPFPDEDSVQLRAARKDPMVMGDQMRRAFADWLGHECGAQPVIVVLEDLHWGDLPTVRCIDAVLRNLRDQPLFILALARPDVHDVFPKLWAERDVSEIRLGELGRRAADKLVHKVLGDAISDADAQRLVERAAGNAFYLEELIRAAAEGKGEALPETVLAMVSARLERLPPAARHVLRAASVFGQMFWRGGVQALVGDSSDARELDHWLVQLTEQEFIQPRVERRFLYEQEYVFRHALVREAAYHMLTDGDRVLGHKLAGEWLGKVGERDARIVAEHCERGGDRERAISWYGRAAEQALGGDDFAAALAAVARAVDLGAGGAELGALRVRAAEAHRWRGEPRDAAAAAEEALHRLAAGTPAWFDAVEEAAFAAGAHGDYEELTALFHQLAAIDSGASPTGNELRACARLATQLLYAGKGALSNELLARCLQHLPRVASEEPAVAARLHSALALRANFEGDVGAFLDEQRRAADCAERAGDLRSACHDRGLVGYACLEAGDYDEAARVMSAVLLTAERMGLGYVAAQQRQNLGLALARLGRLEDARAVEAAAAAAFAQSGNRRMESASKYYLGHILLLAGDSVRAEAETRDALDLANIDPPLPTLRAEGLAVLGQILRVQGRVASALAATSEAMQILERLGGIDGGEFLIRAEHAEALVAAGEDARAAEHLAAARDRLLRCASKISDEKLRASFLGRVPENARIMELFASLRH